MSKPFLRASANPSVARFDAMIPKVEEPEVQPKVLRGRTAETLQKLREIAMADGREAGYNEGFAEGQQDAFEATRLAMAGSVKAFQSALDAKAESIDQQIESWYESAEEHLAPLAAAIAARILGRELQSSDDVISDLAKEVLRSVAAVDKVRIRVHPLDSEILAKQKSIILAASPTVRGVEIVDDPTLEGGVRIESDAGVLDATIRTQLELAYESLRRAA